MTMVIDNVQEWLKGPYDEETKIEIRRLQKEEPATLIDAFYKNLEFGTGGMRGIMGVGTNRLNKYTIGFVTQGIANYIHTLPNLPKKVAISFDSRNHSKEFAEEVAKVFLANGIEVYLYKELRPVPLISFAVRTHKCAFGVMITASHNPAIYNGYKVYGPDGSQVLSPHDENIMRAVERITSPVQVKREASLSAPHFHYMEEEMDQAYLKAIQKLQLHPGDNLSHGETLKIIYTPLHGAGMTLIPRALKEWGFTNVTLVEEQTSYDGNFPTVRSPNPEEREALDRGVALMKKCQGEYLIATDPDTDRIAVAERKNGEIIYFNGNEMAVLLLAHICKSLHESKQFPPKAVVIKTIVTTELMKAIASHYGAACQEVLTGFKYIGQRMTQFEEEERDKLPFHHFLFGAEESYGYLIGTHVRDKDAIISSLIVAELALQLKLQGKQLSDFLYEIYSQYGIWREKLLSLTFSGKEGLEKIEALMESLRKRHPTQINGKAIISVDDYLLRQTTTRGQKEPLLLPKSDVLRFWLEDGSSLVIRPSGTEPKIKLYCSVHEKGKIRDRKQLQTRITELDQKADELLHAFEKLINLPYAVQSDK